MRHCDVLDWWAMDVILITYGFVFGFNAMSYYILIVELFTRVFFPLISLVYQIEIVLFTFTCNGS